MIYKILLILFFTLLLVTVNAQNNSKTFLFVGSYTEGKPDLGIYIYEFNPKSGALKLCSNSENLTNPSFLTISPNGHFLFACTDTKLPKEGSVTVFKIDSVNGRISLINNQPSGGENPLYLTVHKNNKFIINAN